ncbi:MAG: hypothetical protein PHC51_10445 [bacterium]|nr:hypothetical protein [bacterium]
MENIISKLSVLYLLILLFISIGCSSSDNYEIVAEGDYKVAVSSPLMSDGQDRLVHRIAIKEAELFAVCSNESKVEADHCLSGLGLHLEHDGKPDGVVVESCQGACRLFSWKRGDIIISLDGRRVNRLLDVELITDALLKDGKVMIEVIRGGLPHKFYYGLSS